MHLTTIGITSDDEKLWSKALQEIMAFLTENFKKKKPS